MNTTQQEQPKKKYLYMAVTNDKYELPVFFADSGKELARSIGIAPASVIAYVCRTKNSERYKAKEKYNRMARMKLKYIKVELPDDNEDLMQDAPVFINQEETATPSLIHD